MTDSKGVNRRVGSKPDSDGLAEYTQPQDDLAGRKFNRLLVLSFAGRDALRRARWNCICECGRPVTIDAYKVKSGDIKSCGCIQSERYTGLSRHELYSAYRAMVYRCHRPAAESYLLYGARGIKVCLRWRDGEAGKTGFACFLADMGERPSPCHSIDRINNDGNYEPSNCRWATQSEQNSNRRLKQFCKHGHDMTDAGSIYYLKGHSARHCRKCRSRLQQQFRRRKADAAASF